MTCTWFEIELGSTIGSRRATPLRPRQGRRQNASDKPGKSVKLATKAAVRRCESSILKEAKMLIKKNEGRKTV